MDLRFVCTQKIQEHQAGTLYWIEHRNEGTENWRTAKIQKVWSSNGKHL